MWRVDADMVVMIVISAFYKFEMYTECRFYNFEQHSFYPFFDQNLIINQCRL